MACSAAPSQDQANADCPCRALHGEKWSEHIAASKPARSAATTAARSSAGGICSCEAWIPYCVIRVISTQGPMASTAVGHHHRMTPFHLDCDTGIDDALALALLLGRPGAALAAVGTVSGNTSAGQAARNTLDLLALA
nr:hypothetical protein GCM10020092_055070 [Actinoplanes digitatis]